MKKFRLILGCTSILGIIIYNILIQKKILNTNTIYLIVYIYIAIFIIWLTTEAIAYNKKNSTSTPKEYKTPKKQQDISKPTLKNAEKVSSPPPKKYCENCHREIYASNYTGSNLCVECKNYYYPKNK